MKDHHDPARQAATEHPPLDDAPVATAPRRFARFVASKTTRRPVPIRLGLALLAALGGAAVAVVLGSVAIQSLIAWVNDQPRYRLSFREIVLDPPPPVWYRGGAAEFLDRVRQGARLPDEPNSVLDLDLGDITRSFRLYGWVERVRRVERSYPPRLVVRLEYRQPVAVARWKNAAEVVVDPQGTILPAADIDRDAVGPLIVIAGLPPPLDPRPGQAWKTLDPASELARADDRVLAASRLAEFLKSVQGKGGDGIPSLLLIAVNPTDPRGLFAESVERTMILWGEPPGSEPPGHLTAQAKWAMLRDWVERHGAHEVRYPDYLEFTKTGIIHHPELATANH